VHFIIKLLYKSDIVTIFKITKCMGHIAGNFPTTQDISHNSQSTNQDLNPELPYKGPAHARMHLEVYRLYYIINQIPARITVRFI
jgi:hypothetical protein